MIEAHYASPFGSVVAPPWSAPGARGTKTAALGAQQLSTKVSTDMFFLSRSGRLFRPERHKFHQEVGSYRSHFQYVKEVASVRISSE